MRTANIPSQWNKSPEPTTASSPNSTRGCIGRTARKANLLPFVFVMYAYATGGPFGLEDMVTKSGPGLTLLYLLFIPLFWCIPVSLVSAELTTAIPVEGGFYRWVRAGFGDFWGFFAGWWNWSASFLLAATYAVLFADYLTDYISFYFTPVGGRSHYAIACALIALICYVNVRGIQMVGVVSTILEVSVLAVVAAMCIVAALKWQHNPFSPLVPPHAAKFQVFGAGLALGLWLYSGYEQLSSVAEEVRDPQRTYPRALAIVVPLSVATYFLPTLFSLAALGNWQEWRTGYFSNAAQLLGGPWLVIPITVAAMIGNVALLNATVLTSTRMPSTMAEDGYLPAAFSSRHPRYGTPWLAIIASSAVYALLAQKTMVQLLTIYVWLRIGVTILTVLSSWSLRQAKPDMPRPFRIPGGRGGLFYVVAAPLAMSVVALVGSDRFALKWGPVPVLLALPMYFMIRRFQPAKIVRKI